MAGNYRPHGPPRKDTAHERIRRPTAHYPNYPNVAVREPRNPAVHESATIRGPICVGENLHSGPDGPETCAINKALNKAPLGHRSLASLPTRGSEQHAHGMLLSQPGYADDAPTAASRPRQLDAEMRHDLPIYCHV